MRRHQDWKSAGFDHPPTAPAVGPFPRRRFLRLVSGLDGTPVEILEDDAGLVVVACDENGLRLAGDADLTDYRCPLGSGAEALLGEYAAALPSGVRVTLDSLPLEAAEPLAKGLERAGVATEVEQHAVAAVVELPDSFSGYLEMIGKKQRHELRRKRRRYEESVGEVVHVTHTGSGPAFEEFVRLHRLSDGEKARFMTGPRECFFRELLDSPGWRLDVLQIPGTEQAAACLFSYVDDEGLYLYNSSYDPGLAEASPGMTMISVMIEQAIAERLSRFDFLKGDEAYKFRLGAVERPLYRVEAQT